MMYRTGLMIILSFLIVLPLRAQQQIQLLTDYAIYNVNGSPDGGYSMGMELSYGRHIHNNWKIHGGLLYLKVEELNDFLASSYNSIFKYEDETYSDIIVGSSWKNDCSCIIGSLGLSYHYNSFYLYNSIGYGRGSLNRNFNYYARPELEETFRLGEFSFTDEYNTVGVIIYTARLGYDYVLNEYWSVGLNLSFRHVDGFESHVVHRSDEENLDWSSLMTTPEGKHTEFDVMYLYGGISLGYMW